MSHQKLTFWRNSRRLTSLALGVFFLATVFPAHAEYRPKNRKPASESSRGGGSRGCSGDGIPLTLLAPKTFTGKTASTRPMVAWYMSNPQDVRFRIFEFESEDRDTAKQIAEIKAIPTQKGINKFKLPTEYPELRVGKTYFWQIAIDCRIGTVIQRAEFTVVNPESRAKNQFTTIPESVNYYAGKELWYEALEEALKKAQKGKLGQVGSTLVQQLAQSDTVMDEESDTKAIKKRVEHLQSISEDSL